MILRYVDELRISVSSDLRVSKEYAFIHDIWVEPEYRQNKVAQQMVMLCVDRFQEMEIQQIRLDTTAVNKAARRLFASCGFRISTIEMLKELGVKSP
jgi:ribosomal protein S18 acetylase RimI-like enzyme